MATANAIKPADPVVKPRPFAPNALTEPGQFLGHYNLTLPDADYDRRLDSAAYASLARRLRTGDSIACVNDSLTRECQLRVVAADPITARVVVREAWSAQYPTLETSEHEYAGHVMRKDGVTKKWTVTRMSDGHEMRSGFETMSEARQYIISDIVPKIVR